MDSSPFSVMSFNLRYPAHDGHPVARRTPIAAELIHVARPHLIGTQEGELDQLESLITLLPEEYVWLGEGHLGGNSGEFTAIIYDSARFDPAAVEVSWLSETPQTVGSESWGVSHARTLTCVDFDDRVTGRRLRMLNTHLDHRSEQSRLEAAKLIRDSVVTAPDLCLLTGDFNVSQGSPVHDYLTAEVGLRDSAETAPGENIGTFHRYRGAQHGAPRIDWILTGPELVVEATRINTHSSAGEYPSDHFPIEARMHAQADADHPDEAGSVK